jgi:hypothetical protein
MRARWTLIAGLIATALIAAACSQTRSLDLPSPAPLQSAGPGTPTPSVMDPNSPIIEIGGGEATPTPTAVPDDPPPVKPGNSRAIIKGETIAVDLEFDEVEGYPIYEPPESASITWASEDGSLTVGGDDLKKGTFKSSDKLSVTFTVLHGGHAFGGGEKGCEITIQKVTDKVFKGWFSCPAAIDSNTKEQVQVIASFEYKP